ncbi:hypothetical protein [Clostridium botulinum]|uniref:hypothetical protein n=1 Tax=Clostridium botulinum TaxID=1491 RepID=UPI001E508E47|nr:hypothetical protein [Clostridium botulinum]MCD3254344.1 hypothetical protein [Clostridium botulinum C/D]MCD3279844.1 hypothetical protein [Clostridium botulinum C/D]MCD3339623.1 hypothetical protein [Clostridium botulinum C/D]MCD3357483.1 hypothetical protein [Clostridium botulinum C/D]
MGVPSYILNFDELEEAIRQYLENGIKVDVGQVDINTTQMEQLLQDIKSKMQNVDYNKLIEALNTLGAKFEDLANGMGISGKQRVYGEMLEVQGLKQYFTLDFKVPKSGKITDIVYSQSAWNYEDSFDVIVGKEKLFNNTRTKEHGEAKHFNVFYSVNSGDIIKFIYHNDSGSSKIVWADFHILEN